MEGNAERQVVYVSRKAVLHAINELEARKAPGPLEVSLEMIAASKV